MLTVALWLAATLSPVAIAVEPSLQSGGSNPVAGGCMGDTVPPPANPTPKPEKFGASAAAPASGLTSAPGSVAGPQLGSPGSPPPAGPVVGPAIHTYDPLHWTYWWRLERDGFLDVRGTFRRRHALGTFGESVIVRKDALPSRFLVDTSVIPALVAVLQNEQSDAMRISALVALARIGSGQAAGTAPADLEGVLAAQLASPSQVVSETAALALGILGTDGCFAALGELLGNTKAGAELVQRGQVPARTQAFAAFGLGALASDAADVGQRQLVAAVLLDALRRPHSGPDVPVAAMLALGQCALPATATLPPASLRSHDCVDAILSSSGMARWLLKRLNANFGDSCVTSPKERAFCLVALGHFASDRDDALRGDVLDQLRREASDRRQSSEIRSAAIVALGEVARGGTSLADQSALRFLSSLMDASQALERRLATMALAQASARNGAGDDALAAASPAAKALQEVCVRGGSGERSWAALAMGVQAYHLEKSAGAGAANPASAKLVQRRADLRKALAKQRNSSNIGAYALGVALMHKGADDAAREAAGSVVLDAYGRVGEPEARGYVALALGLLGHEPARDALLEDLSRAQFQPDLLWHTAVGLGLIGDERLVPTLIEALVGAKSHSSRAAIAVSLGTVGDRRAVAPLVELIADRSRPTTSRAMAIVGLGVLCEERALPWRNPMAHALPYAALTDTLAGQGNSIFDIL